MKAKRSLLRVESGISAEAQIETLLRQQIVSGKLPAGERLPSTPTFAKEWNVSCTVVQKAMAQLVADGLVERRRRKGTFVKATTDKSVIGLLFGPSLAEESASFYRAVLRALRREMQQFRWTGRTYDGLTGSNGLPLSPDAEVIQELTGDLRTHAFKGLVVFSPGTRGLGDWERTVDLPKVVYELPPAATDVELDQAQFTREAVTHLAKRGCRSLLFLRASWHLSSRSADLDGLFDAASQLSLPRPQIESILLTEQGDRMEREIFDKVGRIIRGWQSNPASRPDGLIVSDDVVMRAVSLALLHARIRVPEELPVVTFANETVDLHYGLPVIRYEFPVSELARRLLQLLWKRIAGEALPSLPLLVSGRILAPGDSGDAAA